MDIPLLVAEGERTYPDHAVGRRGIVQTDTILALVALCENEVVAIGTECVS